MKVVLASKNPHKLVEISKITEKFGFDLVLQSELGVDIDVEETGTTFEENSFLKASVIMDMIHADPALAEKYADSPVIADDSGLMVDALGGAPGVYSARYAGEGCVYDDNNTKLLGELEDVPFDERTAKFVTVITLIYPGTEGAPKTAKEQDGRYILTAKGECHGHIAEEKLGSGGFGYDPVFIPDGYKNSFAQLGTDFKNTISHRANAIAELERLLG